MTNALAPVCLVGQAMVDVTLPQYGKPYRMRLGGILHAARALWAINRPYVLAYAAPDYLCGQVEEFARAHGATATCRFATVSGSPNVMIIGEVKEAGDQGYEYLLRDEHRLTPHPGAVEDLLTRAHPSDMLIISGGFDLVSLLKVGRGADVRTFVDLTGTADEWEALREFGDPLAGVMLSTSSHLFKERFARSPETYWREAFPGRALAAVLKENRGGTRFGDSGTGSITRVPAFLGETEHSVGVGDCFDAVWVSLRPQMSDGEALAYAALVAADYASTTYPDVFKHSARASLSLSTAEVTTAVGVSLPWETRPHVHVYVAGPDFDFADRRPIDAIAEALRYHNFTPRLPVREHGQMGRDASASRKGALLAADLAMLDECHLMVAVLTYDDPGTLIEVGMACERGMPVIVFDPHRRAENLFLTGLPKLVTGDLERVISSVFEEAGRLTKDGQ